MERAGYGGGGYRRRGKKGSCGGRRGERGPPRGGGRWFHHQPQPERGRSWSSEETRRGRYGGGQGFHHLPQPQRGQSGTVSQPWSGHRREGAEIGGRGGEGGPPRGGGGWFYHQPQPERRRSWAGEETRRGRYGGGQGFHRLPQSWRGQSGIASQPRSGHSGEGAAMGGIGGEGGPPRGGGGWFYHQPQPERRRSWSYEETRRGRYGGGQGFHHLPQPWRGQSGTASQPRSGHSGEGAAMGGRGGEGGPPRDGGGWFYHQPQPERRRSWAGEETRRGRYGGGLGLHHLPQPQRGQSGAVCQPRSGHKGEGAEIGVRGREKGGGRAHGGGSSIWPPTGSDHPLPPPSDPVIELGRPQDRQKSASSCMLEAKDKIPVHQPDRKLAFETDRVQVKLKPQGVTMHCNIEPKYRSLWRQVIGIAEWACEALGNWRKYLMPLLLIIEFVRESKGSGA